MVRQKTSTGSPRSAASFVWLVPVVVTAAAGATAAALVSASARSAAIWIGASAVAAVAAAAWAAVRRTREVHRLTALLAEREAVITRNEEAAERLVRELLPELLARVQRGEFPEDLLPGIDLPPEYLSVLTAVVEAVSAEEDLRESAQRAFVNIARRVQAIIHQQALELREMEDRHGNDPAVFGDLLRIDHATALVGRLADSIAVLGGARPGRQWSRAVPLYSVLRGAMSRILDYQRVDLHSVSEVAVVGPAVEPLIHAIAELLDNATRYSPPQTRVHLTAVDVNSGIAVEIEDGGVSMSEEARLRAERMLKAAREGIDLNDLGETPRLGLAVVGRLSQAYGFQVSLRSSAYGGVRAVLIVPKKMITSAKAATGLAHGIGIASGPRPHPATAGARAPIPAPDTGSAAQARAGRNGGPPRGITGPTAAPPARPLPASAHDDAVPVVTERTPNGLPQRRRKAPAYDLAVPAPAPAPVPAPREPRRHEQPQQPETPEEAPPVQPGIWLEAFQSGLAGEDPQTSKGSTQP
ncbi:ATP-binding protein [Streptomyces qinzhouensis]|uniref:histidine kinase n=1 Tax=Streptomyces qinzhouensis TaxID=2599401 RepID=A0A5B8J4P5_9ACTN|nr:ATP-binding protein [Streptomyces qinzhouensis]QDY76755.1 sensor histidine kinase [Streptomyces qinzhouensis]